MIELNTAWHGDATYHDRHTIRSKSRAACIAASFAHAARVLDVGCNRGLIALDLLERGKAASVTGVELAKDAVLPALLRDPRFTLISGDICDIELPDAYDVVVYGAVHHHIVRERGLAAAVEVLRKLAAHCRKHIFFETGHLTEGARWAWQRHIRRYFRTDEEHLFFLLRHIEPYVADFDVVGTFRMHGVRRWLIRIDVKAPPATSGLQSTIDTTERRFERADTPSTDGVTPASDAARALTELFTTVDGRTPRLFAKRRRFAPHIDEDEYRLGRTVLLACAVKPVGLDPDVGVVYPFVDGVPMAKWSDTDRARRKAVAQGLIAAFDAARRETAAPSPSLFLSATDKPLIDVIDMNPNNILVVNSPDGPVVRWVDFERQSDHYQWKNRIHLARMLFATRSHVWFATTQYILGVLGGIAALLRYQLATPRNRIADRQPSLLSFLITEVRSAVDRAVCTLLPSLSER